MGKTVSGYTLIEMVAAMAIGLIVLGTIGATFAIQDSVYRDQTESVRMLENLRAGMEVMTRDILQAGGNGISGIDEARTDYLKIRVAGEGHPIDYQYRKGKMTRCDQPLVENVPEAGLCFTYFDENGSIMDPPVSGEDCVRIRRIGISLTVSAGSPEGNSGRSRTVSTSIALRNPAPVTMSAR